MSTARSVHLPHPRQHTTACCGSADRRLGQHVNLTGGGTDLRLEGAARARLKLHDLAVDQALRLRLLELHVVVPHVGLRRRTAEVSLCPRG